MKVSMKQTQLRDNEVLCTWEGEIPKEFDNIEDASKWIDNWLDEKTKLLTSFEFPMIRFSNAIRWFAMGIEFVEAYDIRF